MFGFKYLSDLQQLHRTNHIRILSIVSPKKTKKNLISSNADLIEVEVNEIRKNSRTGRIEKEFQNPLTVKDVEGEK